MTKELKQLAAAMWLIVNDTRSNRALKVEAARVILSCHGQLLPDVNEDFLSVKQIAGLRAMKRSIVERVLRQKERKRLANRRGYLRRRVAALEAQKQPAPAAQAVAVESEGGNVE